MSHHRRAVFTEAAQADVVPEESALWGPLTSDLPQHVPGWGSFFGRATRLFGRQFLLNTACRCVMSVLPLGWGLSNPAYPHPPRHRLPVPAGFTKSSIFRILARRDSAGVRLITRAGNDFSSRFPFIAMAVSKLPVSSCLIDGEAIVCDENGLAVFDLIRGHGGKASAVLCAFDLLEVDGLDLRRQPIETRKAALAKLLKGSHLSIVLNEYFEEDGASVFNAACQLGCEGIVSKKLGSIYRRGHSPLWLKVKNPNAGREARGGRGLGFGTLD